MKYNERVFLLTVMALALALRLYRIGAQSLWVDEILTLAVSDPKPGLTIWDYLKYNIHGPFHAFVVWLFSLIGHGDGWLRLPSALAGTATVYYLYRWAAAWLGLSIARVAVVFFALHPLHLYYSQEVRNYAFLVFFTTAASYYLYRLLSDDTRRNVVRYTLLMTVAPLCNFSAAFIYAVHSWLYLVRRAFTRGRLLRWVLVSLAILVFISPWVYRIYTFIDVTKLVTPVMPGEIEATERLRGDTTVGPEVLPYAFYTFSVGFTLGPSLRDLHYDATMASVIRQWWPLITWVGVVFGGLFILGLRHVRSKGALTPVLLYVFVPLIFTLLLNWQNAKAFNARYILTSLPVFIFVLAAGVVSLPRVAGRVVATAVALTLVVSMGNYFFNGEYAREDVRGAARLVEERAVADECVLVPAVTEVFTYYYEGEAPVRSLYAPIGTPRKRLDDQLESVLAECGDLWYIRARPWVHDPDDHVLSVLNSTRNRSEVINLDGVTIYVFRQ